MNAIQSIQPNQRREREESVVVVDHLQRGMAA